MTRSIRSSLAAALAAAVLLAAPAAFATDVDPNKDQERFSSERFTAPALIRAEGLEEGQLVAHGAAQAAKQDRLVISSSDCQGFSWPTIPVRCLFSDDGRDRSRQVRMITIEQRVGDNTSVLVRVPATLAQR